MKNITIFSSHGELRVDPVTGVVDKSASDYYQPGDLEEGIESILRIDLEEHALFWGGRPSDGDILDFGYWTDSGDYEPADMDWRMETCIPHLCDSIDWNDNYDPMTMPELRKVALEGRNFGGVPK